MQLPLSGAFRATVQIAKHFDLICGKLIAIDNTKMRAQNSKKNNYSKGRVELHLENIERKPGEYNTALQQNDLDVEKSSSSKKK